MSKGTLKQTEFFESLVNNALDFLATSAQQIEKSPKQSLINLAFAIELFLKARLLAEHWSLIVDKPEKANIQVFLKGNARTISNEKTKQRLENIAGEKILKHEDDIFTIIANHRNKLIHFYNDDYAKGAEKAIEQTVIEQLSAWNCLYRLISERWKEHFIKFKSQFDEVDKLINENRHYLKGKFYALEPAIKKLEKDGIEIRTCNVCNFASVRIDEIEKPLFSKKCLICNPEQSILYEQNILRVECIECNEIIEIEDLGEGTCECGHQTSIDELIDTYGPYEDPKEESEIIYCNECAEPIAIPFRDGHLCLSCLMESDYEGTCGWCNERFSGFDADQSYFLGCPLCDGMKGWDTN
ncbi:hypothetical protein MNBD_DELTA02-210 [hydrothermal vent metagenome]|uniref:Uncharacterized protein n=1 Tax=hydrothermal vent metagenome TaxID=652676 RepID=A0A3B0VEC8_9ZZZZ